MIHSFIPGRIRLKDKIFRDPCIVDLVLTILRKRSSVIHTVEANPLTGSILFGYNPDAVPYTALKPLLPFLLKLEKAAKSYTPDKQEKIVGMLHEFDSLLSSIEASL
ncbi:MAG: HMA2 domain-containing protein [Treponema sp.]